jgi:hypothetical protein
MRCCSVLDWWVDCRVGEGNDAIQELLAPMTRGWLRHAGRVAM